MKWLALALFAYVVCAFLVVEDWGKVAVATFVPRWPKDSEAWKALVAILGTTISPYLFFWQASQEVEEQKSQGRRSKAERQGATAGEIRKRKWDVGLGTLFSNLVMYFIILTTAVTLHARGLTEIKTSHEAAEALRPLAGNFGTLLYALGLIAVGLLAIPTLAGSAAYAFAETFGWKQGLDEKPHSAKQFYIVVVLATALGIAFHFIGFNPIQALFWSGVISGVVAPFLLVGIVLVASDKKLMLGQPSSRLSRLIVWLTAFVMFGAAGALLLL